MAHTSVLLQEILTGLSIKQDDIFLDGTINGGGHSKAVSELLGNKGMIIGLDLDGNAINKAKNRLAGSVAKIIFKQVNFRNLDSVLVEVGIKTVDKILLDLGLS